MENPIYMLEFPLLGLINYRREHLYFENMGTWVLTSKSKKVTPGVICLQVLLYRSFSSLRCNLLIQQDVNSL